MSDVLVLPNRLFDLKLSGTEFRIIAVLSVFGREEFTMRVETMAAKSGLSPATVRRTLAALQGKGLLDIIVRAETSENRGRNTYRAYRLRTPAAFGKRFFRLKKETVERLSGYSPAVLLFYAYLVRCADKKGRAFVSDRKAAHRLGLSKTTVRACANLLIGLGLIGKFNRLYAKTHPTKAHRITQYDLVDLPPVPEEPEENDPQISPVRPESEVTHTQRFTPVYAALTPFWGFLGDVGQIPAKYRVFCRPRPPDRGGGTILSAP